MSSFYKFLWLVGLVYFIGGSARAQDALFSQVWNNPVYLGPSFAGANGKGKVGVNYRDQWPGVKTGFKTYAVSIDNYFSRYGAGVGFFVSRDVAGSAHLASTRLGMQYSHRFKLGRNWQFIPGVQATHGSKSLDKSKLSFGDDLYYGNAISGSDAFIEEDYAGYADGAVSVLFYSNDIWGGLTVDHLMKPKYSFMGEKNSIGRLYRFYGGFKVWRERRYRIEEAHAATFLYNIYFQDNYGNMDLGMKWDNQQFSTGIWYRGLPLKTEGEDNLNNPDALVFEASLAQGNFRFCYSYDWTISELAGQSRGAHEISIIYTFRKEICLAKPQKCFQNYKNYKHNRRYPRGMRRFR